MSEDSKFRGGGWFLVGALAVAGLASGAHAAAPAAGVPAAASVGGSGKPAGRQALTPAERRHIRRLRREGEQQGLTKEQIREEIAAYLRSIGKERTVKGATSPGVPGTR